MESAREGLSPQASIAALVRDQLPADRGNLPPLSTEQSQLACLPEGGRPVVQTTVRSVWHRTLPHALGRICCFLHRKGKKQRDCSMLRSTPMVKFCGLLALVDPILEVRKLIREIVTWLESQG